MNFSSNKVCKLLEDNKLLEIPNTSEKSTVWQNFLYINHIKSKDYIGYVVCKTCKQALKHNKSISGTTHLNDHLKRCKYNAKISLKVTAYFSKSDMSLSKVMKNTVLNSSVAFVVSDVRPLSAMEGDGLIQFANAMIKVGATQGIVDAKAVLPSRFTIKKSIEKSVSSLSEKLIEEVNKAIKKYSLVGITIELWTDLTSSNFYSITIHFISSNLLQSRVICMKKFNEVKTAEKLQKILFKSLSDFGMPFETLVNYCFFVTDNGSNIKLALSSFNQIPYACHMLFTVINHVLQLYSLSTVLSTSEADMVFVKDIQKTIEAVKKAVAYFKKSGLNNSFKESLKQSNNTRWNSTLTMLCSVFNNKVEIIESLAKKDKSNKVDCIDWALVQLFINFLQPFNATKELEGDSYPTIQKVFHCHHMLKNYMKVSPSDSSMLQFLKKRGLQCFKEKFVI